MMWTKCELDLTVSETVIRMSPNTWKGYTEQLELYWDKNEKMT